MCQYHLLFMPVYAAMCYDNEYDNAPDLGMSIADVSGYVPSEMYTRC